MKKKAWTQFAKVLNWSWTSIKHDTIGSCHLVFTNFVRLLSGIRSVPVTSLVPDVDLCIPNLVQIDGAFLHVYIPTVSRTRPDVRLGQLELESDVGLSLVPLPFPMVRRSVVVVSRDFIPGLFRSHFCHVSSFAEPRVSPCVRRWFDLPGPENGLSRGPRGMVVIRRIIFSSWNIKLRKWLWRHSRIHVYLELNQCIKYPIGPHYSIQPNLWNAVLTNIQLFEDIFKYLKISSNIWRYLQIN